MYNLLKRSSRTQDEWEQHQGALYDVSFLSGRVFEHTQNAIKQRFSGDDGPDFDALLAFPCLFTYEGYDVVGSIGRISEVRFQSRRLEITYALPTNLPKIRLNEDRTFQLLGMGSDRGERHRTHWAVKDVDLFEVTTKMLHAAGNIPVVLSEQNMTEVWGERHHGRKLVFLSHRASHRRQVAQVREEIERQGLCCFVAHEDIAATNVWQDEILNALNTMDVFIAFVTEDFHSGGWPDQEVGYAYHRGVPRLFVKIAGCDPVGMVAREQALTTTWERAGQEIVTHLRRTRALR